jgi:glycolate oxidase iron-sulfur subunit
MRAAAEGRTALTPGLARHLDLCLGCRACETACPSGVPFGQLLETTRAELTRAGVRARETHHGTLRALLGVFPHPTRLGALAAMTALYQHSGLQALVRGLGLLAPFKRLRTLEALLPPPAAAAAPVPELTPARRTRRGRVGLLTGCVQRVFFPHVNAETARLLAAAGWDVVAPRGQGCCGALHLHAGRLDEFGGFARDLVRAFPRTWITSSPMPPAAAPRSRNTATGCRARRISRRGFAMSRSCWPKRIFPFASCR